MGKQSKPTTTKTTRSAREQAAAARAASLAAEKRRQRTISIAIGVVIALVVAGIIGGALLVANQTKKQNGAVADPSAALPSGAYPSGSDYAYGVPYGPKQDAVAVAVWEDPQCPACKAFEDATGERLRGMADRGEILLITRPTTFLDRNLKNDSSARAVAAYGCAADAGKFMEYKTTLYANQPQQEGQGYTDEQLLGFAQTVGITGDAYTTFEQCYNDRTYIPWGTNSTQQFYDDGVTGTPTILVDGKVVKTADVVDAQAFQKIIDDAAAAKQ